MLGRSLGHYEILEKLGEGGMGEVYQARDKTLKRLVALKVLPGDFATHRERLERFQREAEALAALDHPNIVTIHSVEEVDGVHFLTMQLVDGECLSEVIPRKGVSVEEFFAIAAPLADALTAAHEKGVIHRDLKPSNIMVTNRGQLKVLDFGLAKLRSQAVQTGYSESTTEALTQEGFAPGTVPYMSPEQVQAGAVDERSDIFSLGVILYQMATGRRPFVGRSSAELTASILRDDPPSVSEFRGDFPRHVSRILRRCLQKAPEARYQVARDLYNDIEDLSGESQRESPSGSGSSSETLSGRTPMASTRPARWVIPLLIGVILAVVVLAWVIQTRPTPVPPQSGALRLAVLPTESSIDNAETADWPNLIQVLLSTNLTGVEDVGVLDPQAVEAIMEHPVDRSKATDRGSVYDGLRRAEVDFVVESTVHPVEDGFQLLGSLVDSTSREILYSASVGVAAQRDLPPRVRDLADSLMSYIQVEVFQLARDDNLRPWVSIYEHDVEAIKAFLQATEYIYRYEPGGAKYLLRALEIDPDFIVARLWVVASLTGAGRIEDAQEHYEYLQSLADQASPVEQAMIDLAGAFVAGDLAERAHQLQFLLQYSPGNHILLENLGYVQAEMGDCQSAVSTITPVVEAHWSYPPLWVLLGECLIETGDLEAARLGLEQALTIGPMMSAVYAMLEPLYLMTGDQEKAREIHRKWIERASALPSDPATEVAHYFRQVATACLDVERPDCAVELIQQAIEYDPVRPESHDLLARALFARGDLDEARAAGDASLDLDPSWAAAHLTLARIADEDGRTQQAVDHYRNYIALASPDTDTKEVERRISSLINQIDDHG